MISDQWKCTHASMVFHVESGWLSDNYWYPWSMPQAHRLEHPGQAYLPYPINFFVTESMLTRDGGYVKCFLTETSLFTVTHNALGW